MEALLPVFDESPGQERRTVLTLRLASERITARDLIRRRVEEEVESFNSAESEVFLGLIEPTDAERSLNGYRLRKRRRLDAEKQVAVALQAFANNGFVLLFDDRQVEDLDEELTIAEGSIATFLKLVPLVGG